MFFKPNEKRILDCAPLYSNPAVEMYSWYSNAYTYTFSNVQKSIYEFQASEELDEIEISCNASNRNFYSIKKFKLIRLKGIL